MDRYSLQGREGMHLQEGQCGVILVGPAHRPGRGGVRGEARGGDLVQQGLLAAEKGSVLVQQGGVARLFRGLKRRPAGTEEERIAQE